MRSIYSSLLTVILLFCSIFTFAQEIRVEPPFWWTGMKSSELQLLIEYPGVSGMIPEIDFPGISVREITPGDHPDYLFVDLLIDQQTAPGTFIITLRDREGMEYPLRYQLQKKRERDTIPTITPADVMYLIMPDRFANGDEGNDKVKGIFEEPDRSKLNGRFGGDLKGITDHLEYFSSLGVTALWLNPVFENNMIINSYHGYSITDFYNVDARFGGNEAYITFITEAHKKGLKVIKDMVFNHIGTHHRWMKRLPVNDWVHHFPEYTRSNFTPYVISDPYASEYDRMRMNNGWFDSTLADLNQKHGRLATYLTQNSLWWIEYAGIDGIRMDTQPYPDKDFMAHWADRIRTEYPGFYLVGEAWLNDVAHEAYWQGGGKNRDGYDSRFTAVADFPLYYGILNGFPKGNDIYGLYRVMTQDNWYPDPFVNKTFLDNHDVSRFFTTMNNDLDAYKLAVTFLLTTRGIPQIYYGTEVLMTGDKGIGNDGVMRQEFPGGFSGHEKNAFTKAGLSAAESEALSFMTKLLQWRKSSQAVHHGALKHFLAWDNHYVYFRYTDTELLMVVLNNGEKPVTLNTARFSEIVPANAAATEIITGKEYPTIQGVVIPARTPAIFRIHR
mgnify:FL=1